MSPILIGVPVSLIWCFKCLFCTREKERGGGRMIMKEREREREREREKKVVDTGSVWWWW